MAAGITIYIYEYQLFRCAIQVNTHDTSISFLIIYTDKLKYFNNYGYL